MRTSVLLLIAAALPVAAQTKVDLRTQSKGVDFSEAAATRPLKTGTTLPATCLAGEMFFKTDATPGSNIYGCTNDGVWRMQSGLSTLTVQNSGVVVGTQAAQNFIAGPGLLNVMTDTGTRINIQQNVDTAVVQTRAAAQSGEGLLCAPSSGSGSAFLCSMSPTLTSYTPGMVLFLKPDTSSAGGEVTIDIDTLGPVPVRLADGVTDPTGAEIIAGRLYPIWYDGACFRLLIPPMNVGFAVASRPACDASHRGRLWQTFGGQGVKDEVAVCAKDGAEGFAWRVLY